ncbi:hypothetical protein [Pedobacter heparinus]|uniref:hypothetical protein n=1 Tax=Pedobacter heparinus TaxID=984 RepID=UPI00292DB1AC|nr:hypothetical protein [Pedobacter heparinus]
MEIRKNMNRYLQILSLFVITTLILTTNSQAQSFPKIGDTWNGAIDANNKMYMPPPYGFENLIEFEHNGRKFSGAVKEGKIVGILTTDTTFEINKIRYMDRPLSAFQNKDKVKLILGWANYLPVEDGWYAAFSFDRLTDASKVAFLFKVDFEAN